MKRFLAVVAMVMASSLFTQAFTPINKSPDTKATSFNYARFMRSLWLNPAQGLKRSKAPMAFDYYVSINNYWQANVIVNYISLEDPNLPASGSFPLDPGDTGSATDNNFSGAVWVNITIPGPPEDPEATRIMYYQPGVGFPSFNYCQTISGSGTYSFIGVQHSPGAYLYIDTGECW